MADVSMPELLGQIDKLAGELDRRARSHRILESYNEGSSPFPAVIQAARVTKAYRRLMPVADAPWGSLVVGSVLDRLEVGGIRDENKATANRMWGIWQTNHMDSESLLAHDSGLVSGRAFALVWPDQSSGEPEISLDNAATMVVQYAEGSRHTRVAALRRWQDFDGPAMCTLYRPDGIYKFQEAKPSDRRRAERASAGKSMPSWVPRVVDGEEWPVKNPFGVVPVVEIRFNPRLKPGVWGHCRGEYSNCLGLIDRINLLTFLGLVVAFWMGFPVRAVIGDRILRDDDGNVIPPFNVEADTIVQLENPNAKLDSYSAADRSNLSIYPELAQLAAITKTPRHYFPLAQAMANLSADAIRADEGALNAKVVKHKASAGEGWEEVLRLCGVMIDQPLSPRAELVWLDHESRSLAERADAATKLSSIMPWQALAEHVLNATQDEIARWEAMRASDALGQLVAAVKKPPAPNSSSDEETPETPEPAPVPG